MDGFKNSTKTHYMKGGACDGYAKGGQVKGAAKISKVMGEFKSGKLHSGSKSGPEVTNKKQAVAIALSEARKAGAKVPVKKANGGRLDRSMMESTSARPVKVGMTDAEKAAAAAVARGNRIAVEEGSESRLVSRKAAPRTREVSMEDKRSYTRAEPSDVRAAVEPVEPQTALSKRLTTLPSQRGEMRRGPSGAGFSVAPLVSRVRNALGLKKGGLSAMPSGKKR